MRNQCSQRCFRITFSKTIEKKKIFVSKHVHVVNLDPAVMTLAFGASIDIHDTVRYILGNQNGNIFSTMRTKYNFN